MSDLNPPTLLPNNESLLSASNRRWHWRRFWRNRTAILGLFLTTLVIFAALFANQLAPTDPFKFVGNPLTPPSSEFWFGTDNLGRDVFAGIIHGSRTSLLVGLSVAGAALIIGVLVGGVAGFYGKYVDDVLMRFTELIQVMPRFFLALMVVALFGSSLRNLIVILSLTYWSSTARLTRANVLSIREMDYVAAARALGLAEPLILLRHVLPNGLAPVIVHASLQVGRAILIEASLSFLGLGDPNQFSWGFMLNNAQEFLRRAWWMSVFPGLAIALTVLGVNLLGDSLNDYWNPKLYRR